MFPGLQRGMRYTKFLPDWNEGVYEGQVHAWLVYPGPVSIYLIQSPGLLFANRVYVS
jgi:hypothetical protein